MARAIGEFSALAVGMTKQILQNETEMDVETAMEAEARIQAILMRNRRKS